MIFHFFLCDLGTLLAKAGVLCGSNSVRKGHFQKFWLGSFLLGLLSLLLGSGVLIGAEAKQASNQVMGPHGGVLCALEECPIGIVETLVSPGEKIELWFFSGSERKMVPEFPEQKELHLLFTFDGKAATESRGIDFSPNPASQSFLWKMSGTASEPVTLFQKPFSAYGWVWQKNRMRHFEIVYPHGLHVNCAGHSEFDCGCTFCSTVIIKRPGEGKGGLRACGCSCCQEVFKKQSLRPETTFPGSAEAPRACGCVYCSTGPGSGKREEIRVCGCLCCNGKPIPSGSGKK